jgi:tetratricopeptide (TPR) repeat protein
MENTKMKRAITTNTHKTLRSAFGGIVMLAAVAALPTACREDLMDTKPYNAISSELMWSTKSLAEQGVIGVYNVLRQPHVASEIFKYDAFGISSAHRNGTQDAEVMLLMGDVGPSKQLFADAWKQHYEGIHRANDAIKNLPNAPLEEDVKARLIAECKFLRAYFYYKLNMVFQGVPLYLEPEEVVNMNKPRETPDSIWKVVIRDLTDCISSKGDFPDRYSKGSLYYGRATRGAAYALRGKVYLWTKEWKKAESDFRKVGDDCGYKLYEDAGADSYRQLFKEANEQNREFIFSLQNIGVSSWGNEISFRYGSRSAYDILGGGWHTYLVNTGFVDSYQNKDGSEFSWDSIIPGYVSKNPADRELYFYRDTAALVSLAKSNTAIRQILDTLRSVAKRNPEYRAAGNEARIQKAYAARDPRLQATVITPYSTFLGAYNGEDCEYTMRWPAYSNNNQEPRDLMFDGGFTSFCYLFRKFVAEGSKEIPRRDYSPIDFPLIRYADVLLGLAEALNEQGRYDDAIKEINKVRQRAGVAALNSAEYKGAPISGKDDVQERIRNERRWEFAGEGVNYFDEIRWQTWKKTKFEDNNGLKQIWGAQVYSKVWPGNHCYLWPVPLKERQMNPKLEQNPGWRE